MTDQQLNHFMSLSEEDKHIINVGALMGSSITVSSVADIVQSKIKVTQKHIKECLDEAIAFTLFHSTTSYSGRIEYEVNLSFAIALYPFLKDYQKEWKSARSRYSSFYGGVNQVLIYSELIYNLLHDEKKYKESELDISRQKSYSYNNKAVAPDISDILLYEPYEKVLPRMSSEILLPQVRNMEEKCYRNLDPLDMLRKRLERVVNLLPESVVKTNPEWKSRIFFLLGLSDAAMEAVVLDSYYEKYFIQASECLLEQRIDDALELFEKGMKGQRSVHKGLVLPLKPEFGLFYLLALRCSEPQKSAAVFNKQLKFVTKKDTPAIDYIFSAVAAFCTGDKVALGVATNYFCIFTGDLGHSLNGLLSIPIMYMADQKPKIDQLKSYQSTVRMAFDHGYNLLAYEAAYVLCQWSSSEEVKQLYEEIAQSFKHRPAVSALKKQEPWEQVLNTFLAFDNNKKGKVDAAGETSKYRVLYFISTNFRSVQPVLQTRTTKGWTKGRNIGLKTFGELAVEGMTEQDVRIAKHIKKYEAGWGAPSYQFNDSVVKDMVANPYIYLDGVQPVPVELMAAQPVLSVKKTKDGYTMSTNLKDADSKYILEKETNTRYHLFELSNEMQQLLQRVIQQKIIIPEQGKEKLMQALSVFSSRMVVQSDLIAGENSLVRTLPADNRIRVQLLPFGNGLKAELFTKPFGDSPPYCKPGKGGTTLITKKQNEQIQTTRNLAVELEYANLLMNEIQSLEVVEITNELLTFDEPESALELLEILAAHEEMCVVEWPEGVRFRLRSTAATQQLQLRIKSKTNWFELEGELQIDENTVLSLLQLMELTAGSKNRFIELKTGEFIALSEQLKKQLDDIRNYSVKGKNSLNLNPYASLALGDVFDHEVQLKADKTWKDFRKRVKASQDIPAPIPSNLQADLRSYQEDGYQWMARLADWNAGACLADDMGLGKTVQALAILLQRASLGPAMVVSPVSVLPNWMQEAERFAPTLNIKTLAIGGRNTIFQSLQAGDLLLISYGLLQSEVDALSAISFASIVLDEAHTIKNVSTKTSQAAMKLQASFRLALTGTPIQNHLGEIWNLFNFINPGLLGSLGQFTEHYVKNDDATTRKQLKRLISPFLLRRTKSAVLEELPPKTEILYKIPLSTEERTFYEALRRNALAKLEESDDATGTKHLKALAEITRLRQACCNPALVDASMGIESSKLTAFLELVAELKENNHRALVFSQFVGHLSLIRQALNAQNRSYLYLDGSTPMKERAALVNLFQQGGHDLFLISLKAGGLGLNLTAADYIIHLDPWWNPAIEDQASDRAHRIGQNRPVTVYRLVAEDTIEEKILKLHHTKRDLADTLLEGSDQAAKLSLSDLLDILKIE